MNRTSGLGMNLYTESQTHPQTLSLFIIRGHCFSDQIFEIEVLMDLLFLRSPTWIRKKWYPTSGGVVELKTGRREVPGLNPVALFDLTVRSFPWFSPKLA